SSFHRLHTRASSGNTLARECVARLTRTFVRLRVDGGADARARSLARDASRCRPGVRWRCIQPAAARVTQAVAFFVHALGLLLALARPATPPMLCLGDSYTAGEGVARGERWPERLAHALLLGEPEVIARTGWTSDDLLAAVERAHPRGARLLVT